MNQIPTPEAAELLARYQLAQQIAREAGDVTLQYFQKPIEIDRKEDNSPVTVADRAAETLLREAITRAFPEDEILGEEFGVKEGTSAFRWILDPIDGTKSFISGVPLYGTLIGIVKDERSVAGVIHMPALNEMVHAAVGQGAWYQRRADPPVRAHVSDTQNLADGLFVFSERHTFDERVTASGNGARDAFLELEAAAGITRTWGDCYGYLLVATGRAVVMMDPILCVWDAAALQPILEEAGGTFTDWQGEPTVFHEEGVGTNGRVLDEVLAVTRRFGKVSP